ITPTESSTYTRDSNLLFKKVYDGLTPPLTNDLQGTCHVGQLISTGVEQETINGEALRRSYIGDDQNLNLFPASGANLGPDGSVTGKVVFRGDDQQRTLMSGQILVEALFPTTEANSGVENVLVDWHTADYDSDPIYPNSKVCPRLNELQAAAYSSLEFQSFNTSAEASYLESIMQEDLGGADWMHILDCQMTSLCTGRPLPSVINDFSEDDDDSNFSRIYRHASDQLGKVYTHNDNEYAKLAMAPVLSSILTSTLLPSLTASSRSSLPTLLHITSGHDTTVMPLLAALGVWDGAWSPYASMLVIETYLYPGYPSDFPSGRAFRLVYNGDVLTGSFEGCGGSGDLCDLGLLTGYLEGFAKDDRDCEIRDPVLHYFSLSVVFSLSRVVSLPPVSGVPWMSG
ncbi:hypothetical protein TrRE_jg12384, partial [Triparma retinervis]